MLFFLTGRAQIQVNGSYLNLTRPAGGPVVNGDIVELRAVISVPNGTTINGLYYTGSVPAGSVYQAGTLKVVTNENAINANITNTGNYTDAADGDAGKIVGTAITIYMGTGATASAGGQVIGGTTTPRFQSNASIFMVTYQVKITGTLGSVVSTNGVFNYSGGSPSGPFPVPINNFSVSQYYSCSSMGTTQLITDETNGTFGTGSQANRIQADTNVKGYVAANIGTNAPVDGQYSIVKNTSPTNSTNTAASSGNRVFGVWDINGDHTGTSTAAGKAPPAAGTIAGYMLAVNATFTPASVFKTKISGLVPNNIYTISFWVRNLCGSCANNPVDGTSLTTPGVLPNIAIDLRGKNYYSTGNINYSGGWVQKSFTFQNLNYDTATLEIKNNAPGGGGNDWAIDDISMKQCLIVLPLGLQSFTGSSTSQGTVLNWQLEPSPELRTFIIERSTDGVHFQSIGEQAVLTDSSNYQYTDPLLPTSGSTIYYRIELVDFDGNSNYSNIVVIRTNDNGSLGVLRTSLAPNPARTSTTLAIWSAIGGKAEITLWNTAGTLISSRESMIVPGTNTIGLSLPGNLPAGIYIVKTITGSESSVNRLIIQ